MPRTPRTAAPADPPKDEGKESDEPSVVEEDGRTILDNPDGVLITMQQVGGRIVFVPTAIGQTRPTEIEAYVFGAHRDLKQGKGYQ